MTMIERLSLHRQVEERNEERIKSGFLNYQKVGNYTRVVIEAAPALGRDKFWVSAQQYAPNFPRQEEVRPDGWRETSGQMANGYESAKLVFFKMVADEQRFVESTRR